MYVVMLSLCGHTCVSCRFLYMLVCSCFDVSAEAIFDGLVFLLLLVTLQRLCLCICILWELIVESSACNLSLMP